MFEQKNMTAPYEDMVKILQKCAEEQGIPKKLIKEIYDMERDQSHLSYRNNEIDLRTRIIGTMKEKNED